jgi:ADP-heptose:LPS heptosyltransferase
MGFGDEIMALGRAEVIYNILGKPVSIRGVSGNARTHEIWLNHPAVDPKSPLRIVDGPSARPYILKWERKPIVRSIWNNNYKARAGHIKLTAKEQAEALCLVPEKPYVIVEPIVRNGSSQNKDWGFHRWEEVIYNFPVPVYQFKVDDKTHILPGAKEIKPPSFRVAAGIIEHAALVMTPDGGTHHMAASMGTPAIVIFGGFADPKITGYKYQTNFYISNLPESFCGRYSPCEHCKQAMSMILPEDVRQAALKILKKDN